MNNYSLKSIATRGMIWNAVEKFSTQGGQLIIYIVLARLLMPEDFGLIGMLSIFIAISQTFIDSGMGSGLIQKKDRSEIDFSTVFVFNLAVSTLLYVLLFVSSPLIANFYEKAQLTILTRVLGLNLIINSFAIVQRTKFTIDIDFKILAKINVISVIISGVFAITSAYIGMGVWALVILNLIRAFVTTLLLWFYKNWRLSLKFSKQSFKNLFGFGSKLLIAGLYANTLREVYNIVIGKAYSAAELGYYTTSKRITDISAGTVTSILQQVTYPILASLQNEKERLISAYSRLIRMTAFVIFPAMTLSALLADPFIRLLFTEEWAPAIVLLQWLCFAHIVTPISTINMNILNAVGRSDLFLKVDLSKAPIIIATLIITIPMGLKAIVIGNVINTGLSFFINAYMPGKLFGYGAFKQLKDMIPVFVATGFMALFVYLGTLISEIIILDIIIGIVLGLLTYLFIAYIFKMEELKEIINLFKLRFLK